MIPRFPEYAGHVAPVPAAGPGERACLGRNATLPRGASGNPATRRAGVPPAIGKFTPAGGTPALHCPATRHPRRAAFSLIELLVVVAILGVLMVLSLGGLFGGSTVGLATETVAGALSSARQQASAKNREVEVRLISMKNPTFLAASGSEMRAVQILEVADGVRRPLGRPRVLPEGVIIGSAPALSSLAGLDSTNAASSDTPISGIGTDYSYRVFSFRPDGSTDLKTKPNASNDDKYYLTLYQEKTPPSGNTPPPDFATIQIEPDTGAYKVYRP